MGFPLVEQLEEELADEDLLGFFKLRVVVVEPHVGVGQASQFPEFGGGLNESRSCTW